jgi:hypothetical protein
MLGGGVSARLMQNLRGKRLHLRCLAESDRGAELQRGLQRAKHLTDSAVTELMTEVEPCARAVTDEGPPGELHGKQFARSLEDPRTIARRVEYAAFGLSPRITPLTCSG